MRKSTKEDVDGVISERDELKKRCEQLSVENARLSEQTVLQEKTLVSSSSQLLELNSLQDQLLEHEEARTAGIRIIEEKSREIARLEKIVYDKDVALENIKSDLALLNEDMAIKEMELQNLLTAFSGVESQHESHKMALTESFEQKISELQEEHNLALSARDCAWEEELNNVGKNMKKAQQQLQDAVILQRKAELDLDAEKRKMQKTVESAISQIRNTEENVVDRALVANLVVQYFKKRRSREVMDLIAKILAFDDDQRVAVGLKVGTIGFRHAVGSIFKSIVTTAIPNPQEDVQGDNLAELWVNFLLEETKEEEVMSKTKSLRPSAIKIGSDHVCSSDSRSSSGSSSPNRASSADTSGSQDFTTISLTPNSPTFSRNYE